MCCYHMMFFLALICAVNLHTVLVRSADTNLETYIVHVELPSFATLSSRMDDLHSWYQTFLPTTTLLSSLPTDNKPRIIHSYHNVFKGFAARLSPEQAKAMEKIPGFISARPQKILPLHTTHSPNFLGLNQNTGFWSESNYGRGIIIGVLDGGVNPNHPSFNDEGMPPPPTRWRGQCQFNTTASCNNKLIGARYFTAGDGTPFDENGHGTHTASTAAGNFVRGASVFGNANGTAAGVAPLAHLAIYKVCNIEGRCPKSDIMAGMDAAIDDGVNVISISLGMPSGDFLESVVVGAFTAVDKGIFVSAAAGNYGPSLGTISNGAPWILTVGASTSDRTIRATALLGNNEQLHGESTFQPVNFPSTLLPLVYPGMTSRSAASCHPTHLRNVQGKFVLCEAIPGLAMAQGRAVRDAGGVAMILINQEPQGYTTSSSVHVLPATHLSYADGLRIKSYLRSTLSPRATISFKGTVIGDNHAPTVACYSSRGPNTASPGILKPDIIGPGHNILAAWHKSVENNPNTEFNFNIISGTSMSCPHLSGVAALLKSVHPDWSPAAIKSAIMTTADQVNLGGNRIEDETLRPANALAMGSGYVNILKARDPGLVYDISPQDYVPYLCGLGYTDQLVGIFVNRVVSCSEISSISQEQLNYPSFSVFLQSASETYNRTVTNVGDANSIYIAGIAGLSGVQLTVKPSALQFSQVNQKLTYQVTFSRLANATSNTIVDGSLTWNSATHSVRSPIVVFVD